ncbi:hypothetical protein [Microbulbifer sp. 2205BS26-8]|uniref:hypothetical protein n=1 Tax=Microbulbifer sp. 2205BS26-8 TaxID=3064386 RepID=UPI00273F2587|nr:hypothetical protein [Microbulbifer sp. 2205BS26-8]MDP5208220.1 hypothetical protein [Microbulbifer sp. 2205BS26-8]
MGRYSKLLLAIGIGILVSAVGVIVTGYLAAIAIPKAFFLWLQEHLSLDLGFVLITIVQQILGFGFLFLAAGYFTTKRLCLSPIISVLCILIGFWLYLVVGVALVYETPISNPIPTLNTLVFITLGVHLLFLVLGVVLGNRDNTTMRSPSA